jgi:hypothetical protein
MLNLNQHINIILKFKHQLKVLFILIFGSIKHLKQSILKYYFINY